MTRVEHEREVEAAERGVEAAEREIEAAERNFNRASDNLCFWENKLAELKKITPDREVSEGWFLDYVDLQSNLVLDRSIKGSSVFLHILSINSKGMLTPGCASRALDGIRNNDSQINLVG